MADLGHPALQRIAIGDLRRLQAVQQQVHLRQHVGQWLGFLAEQGAALQLLPLLGAAHLRRQVVVGLDQKAAGATGRVEQGFAQLRVHHLHHEAHHRARGIELASITCGIAHLAQHRLIQVRQRVGFFAAAKVDAVDLVDDVAQQVAADHAVLDALEDVGHHLTLAALGTLPCQTTQVGEQAFATGAVGAHRHILADEGQQFVTGDAVRACGPVAPAVRRFDDGLVAPAVEFGLLRVQCFEVIEELEEHHPGEQGQTVHVAVEALVLAQDLAGAADQGRQVVAGGQGGGGLLAGLGRGGAGLSGWGGGQRGFRCLLGGHSVEVQRESKVIGRSRPAAGSRPGASPAHHRSGGWRFHWASRSGRTAAPSSSRTRC